MGESFFFLLVIVWAALGLVIGVKGSGMVCFVWVMSNIIVMSLSKGKELAGLLFIVPGIFGIITFVLGLAFSIDWFEFWQTILPYITR